MQGRPRRRPGAHVLRQLYRLALGARVLPRLHRLRLRPVCGRELPRHAGRPRPRARRTHPRRGRHLPGALLRAARPRPARLMAGHDETLTTRDRFRGALLGLAVGAAMGAPGETIDATEMMLCLAESLADVGGFDPEDIIERYRLWFESQPRHVSLTVRATLLSYRSGTHGDLASRRAFEILGGPTAGNGSIIRCAPRGQVPVRSGAIAEQ